MSDCGNMKITNKNKKIISTIIFLLILAFTVYNLYSELIDSVNNRLALGIDILFLGVIIYWLFRIWKYDDV